MSNIIQLQDMVEGEDTSKYQANLKLMFGAEALTLAQQLLNQEVRFFGLGELGNNMQGSQMLKCWCIQLREGNKSAVHTI